MNMIIITLLYSFFIYIKCFPSGRVGKSGSGGGGGGMHVYIICMLYTYNICFDGCTRIIYFPLRVVYNTVYYFKVCMHICCGVTVCSGEINIFLILA